MSRSIFERGMWRSRWAAVGAAVAVSIGAGGVLVSQAAVSSSPSLFHGLSPARVFDTRTGEGGVPIAPLTADGHIDVTVGGTHGVPADATSVVLNVTVVGGTAGSVLTVWPTGDTRPGTSSLNWSDNDAHPNSVTVALGTAGKVSFHNLSGTVNVLADVMGYYTASSGPTVQYPVAQVVGSPALTGSITSIGSTPLVLPDACPGVPDKWSVRVTANGYYLTGSNPTGTTTIGLNVDTAASYATGTVVNQNFNATGQWREVFMTDYLFTNLDAGSHTFHELAETNIVAGVSAAQNRLIVQAVAATC